MRRCSKSFLQKFVVGELKKSQIKLVWDHIAECDNCLRQVVAGVKLEEEKRKLSSKFDAEALQAKMEIMEDLLEKEEKKN